MRAEIPWKVVVVDDEEDVRDVLTVSLEDAGYHVLPAPDGETGLMLCRELLPQILVTDIRMPGMNGLDLLETVKETQPEIEVIVITAFGEVDTAVQALRLDASDFITKPISDEALHLALERAVNRYDTRQQLALHAALLDQESVQTTQELLRNISFQRRLIDSSMDGILGCDREEVIGTFNRAMERMLGYPKHEVLWRKRVEHFFSVAELRRFREALEGDAFGGKGKLYLYETELAGAGGQSVPVQVSATEILENDRREGLVCFFRDLRDLRRLEREMADQAKVLHQDKMMSLGRLAASVVHEINNPLSGILNYAKLMKRILERGIPAPQQLEKFQRYLDLVESESGRCSRIVSNLLAFSRQPRLEVTDVALNEVIEKSVLLSRHRLKLQGISLEVSLAEDLPLLRGDAHQLQQCVINLVFNAVDAMPEGGRLFVGTEREGGHALIRVRDTGTGIDPEALPHIFEPFFTTKKEGYGVGMGLSTVYGIVERHKGRLEAGNPPGGGAEFVIRVPVSGLEESTD